MHEPHLGSVQSTVTGMTRIRRRLWMILEPGDSVSDRTASASRIGLDKAACLPSPVPKHQVIYLGFFFGGLVFRTISRSRFQVQ